MDVVLYTANPEDIPQGDINLIRDYVESLGFYVAGCRAEQFPEVTNG